MVNRAESDAKFSNLLRVFSFEASNSRTADAFPVILCKLCIIVDIQSRALVGIKIHNNVYYMGGTCSVPNPDLPGVVLIKVFSSNLRSSRMNCISDAPASSAFCIVS